MYIKPLYDTVDTDKRLVSITTEIRKLTQYIYDAEWQEQDVTLEKQTLRSLKHKHDSGINFEPLF
jgi:hypothetical protein